MDSTNLEKMFGLPLPFIIFLIVLLFFLLGILVYGCCRFCRYSQSSQQGRVVVQTELQRLHTESPPSNSATDPEAQLAVSAPSRRPLRRVRRQVSISKPFVEEGRLGSSAPESEVVDAA